ncbi:thioredoxin domain-containing protein [soil metagenome]
MNRLGDSTSPYLLQHADNPFDWHEWGANAFEEASKRDLPVLLSVGYSACHWCHVMAHESFEDPETAEEMNRQFVNIKVDREERPDVDAVYMEAVQAMTGQGGWPMTVWLTPSGEPFYAGTYFPKTDRGPMPSFRRVLGAISHAWQNERTEVSAQAKRIREALNAELAPADGLPGQASVDRAFKAIAATFDSVHGGFGRAPKFPQQPLLEFLLRRPEPEARAMVIDTLTAMARGGIHDQLAGGFARYSVDHRWVVPHFEKMLYDNAQLARLYLWAGIEGERLDLVDVARKTLDYLLTDLRHESGGFISAEDADSEGVEGKFYVWDHSEFVDVLGEDAEEAAATYGVTREGNFEGTNILVRTDDASGARAEAIRERLLARRSQRVRPGKDDKVVAGWNGLAIRALAEAGAALGEPRYLEASAAAARFVLGQMSSADGGLLRTWAKGRPGKTPGFLEDYGAMGVALLSLFAATSELTWFQEAERLIRQIPGRFGSEDGAMFSSENDDLIKRPRDLFDNPSPSGNMLAAEALLQLSLYTGDDGLAARARSNLQAVGSLVDRFPSGVGYALALLTTLHRGTHELAILGNDRDAMESIYWAGWRPHIVLASADEPTATVPLLADRPGRSGGLAYLCSGMVCLQPTPSTSELASLLEST